MKSVKENKMPYDIRKGSGSKPYKIFNKDKGKVVGSSTSKAKAQASIRARYAGEGKKRGK